jgi:hypothetical protein
LTLSCASGSSQPAADFYRDKTINLYVGFPPGGGYDIYARVLAAHFGRHVPGNPSIVVRNMTGGSGVRAAGYISTVTLQDGTSLGIFLDGITLGKVLGGGGDFDPLKLVWIGRIVSTATVAVVWHTSPGQSVEDAKNKEIIVAASVAGSTSSIIPTALNDLIGTRFKVIRGFQGSAKQSLAMEADGKENQNPVRPGYATDQGAARQSGGRGVCDGRSVEKNPQSGERRPGDRTLDRRGAGHSTTARRCASPCLHGDNGGP